MCDKPNEVELLLPVKVDACMVKLILTLQEYGIKTTYHCCGHGKSVRGLWPEGYHNGGYIGIDGEHTAVYLKNNKKIKAKDIHQITLELPSYKDRERRKINE